MPGATSFGNKELSDHDHVQSEHARVCNQLQSYTLALVSVVVFSSILYKTLFLTLFDRDEIWHLFVCLLALWLIRHVIIPCFIKFVLAGESVAIVIIIVSPECSQSHAVSQPRSPRGSSVVVVLTIIPRIMLQLSRNSCSNGRAAKIRRIRVCLAILAFFIVGTSNFVSVCPVVPCVNSASPEAMVPTVP